MNINFNSEPIKNFKAYYDTGYRCILYEVDQQDNLFTVYLKNFNTEDTRVLKYTPDDGYVLKNYIDRLT
ncbi:hypothetical protein RH915_07015 [Serpentinicella sp. ANB-PHB4]|uniref:hypothetical protein n=1 Tax=Serpentinicella sp. ANB-PHB4 TaxID=3074076 RepID=UPI002865F430|nr:hypothetical protein [Serpentinicella sp. ANB-PHB4]MDR5659237.1 hypothetical protein [Serpentinicella sp. ANB-PHB4]